MTELHKQFEGLENVKDKLKWVYFCNEKYFERELEYRSSAIWMNGAWYAFQEQQKKIDEFVNIIHDAYMSNGNSSVEIVYDKVQELLK